MHLEGTPSDRLPEVLATGVTDVTYSFTWFAAGHAAGRDAELIEWHSMDHRPEQHRLPGLRNSLRLVSTPACRAARAASAGPWDKADHVMHYQFTGEDGIPAFAGLFHALAGGKRMRPGLPGVGLITADLAGKSAAARAVAGADVIPWRPALGVYIVVEKGHAAAADLIDIPGVAGVWWYRGNRAPQPFESDTDGQQITFCYLDEDPVAVAARFAPAMQRRWASGEVQGVLAAPFYQVVPFEWSRYLPGGA